MGSPAARRLSFYMGKKADRYSRSSYRKYHKLKFYDEEIYDEIKSIIYDSSRDCQNKNNRDFRKTLYYCLDLYLDIINDTISDNSLKYEIKTSCDKIKDIVNTYSKGLHNTAFTKLKNFLDSYLDKFYCSIPLDEKFYRMRSTEKRKDLNRCDIFHVPLNQLRNISSQRYSFPGYPCLYLGKSLYVCWEELQRPDMTKSIVSEFKTQKEIKLLDLRIPPLETFF